MCIRDSSHKGQCQQRQNSGTDDAVQVGALGTGVPAPPRRSEHQHHPGPDATVLGAVGAAGPIGLCGLVARLSRHQAPGRAQGGLGTEGAYAGPPTAERLIWAERDVLGAVGDLSAVDSLDVPERGRTTGAQYRASCSRVKTLEPNRSQSRQTRTPLVENGRRVIGARFAPPCPRCSALGL